MKRILTAIVFLLASSLALALPTPKDIEMAVKAGQLPQAEAMLHEVIKEKPGSAKAHYELGQVLAREGKNADARQELLEARRIDPSLKFVSDPRHFEELLNKLPAAAAAGPAAKPANGWQPSSPAALPAADHGFPWGYVLLGGGVLVALWLFARRAATAAAPRLGTTTPGGMTATTGGGYGYGGPGYGAPPQAPGSGVGGAVLGGLAGLAAGYGLSKVLENSGEGHHAQTAADDSGFVPIDSTASPNSTPDYGSFDMGAGDSDSWDGADSSSGEDNSW